MTRQREKGSVTITSMMEAMIRSLATTLGASSHTPDKNNKPLQGMAPTE